MSTLILYKNSRIIPERNFKVDSLSSYLDFLTKETISNFQYIKHSMTLTIKIAKVQSSLDYLVTNNIDYCSIQNDGESVVYYFIVGKSWKSKECLELTLYQDTINSFLDNCVLSDKTKVVREHKDRFDASYRYFTETKVVSTIEKNVVYNMKRTLQWTISKTQSTQRIKFEVYRLLDYKKLFDEEVKLVECIPLSLEHPQSVKITKLDDEVVFFSLPNISMYVISIGDVVFNLSTMNAINGTSILKVYKLKPLIDFYSEGLSPILFKKSSKEILDQYQIAQEEEENSFYLIYKNREAQQDNSPVDCFLCADESFTMAGSTGTYSSGTFTIGANTKMSIYIYYNENNSQANLVLKERYSPDNLIPIVLSNNQCLMINNNFLSGTFAYVYQRSGDNWTKLYDFEIATEFVYEDCGSIRTSSSNFERDNPPSPNEISNYAQYLSSSGTSEHTIQSINTLDKTLSTLIKILKIPYAPTGMSKDIDGNYLIDNSIWQYDSSTQFLKLVNTSLKFDKVMNLSNDINPFEKIQDISKVPELSDLRNIQFETKLFNSDYYQPKIVYDSFSFVFQLEKITTYQTKLSMRFVMSTTINSRFMFVFDNYDIIGKSEQDYDNVMPIARNNEIVLYNSSYLNYVRTGFNYDVKSKQRSQQNSLASFGAGVVGGILSIAGGVVSQNPFLVGIGITALTTTAVNTITTANSIAQSEQNIQSKLLQYRNQAVSVEGSDDVDLMSYYTNGNKAKFVVYEISERMKEALFDVFHYTGYVSNEIKVPVFNSRKWFNFVSAEIVFYSVPNLSSQQMEDLKNRFKDGITFLHKNENTWDFEQVRENWETSFFL